MQDLFDICKVPICNAGTGVTDPLQLLQCRRSEAAPHSQALPNVLGTHILVGSTLAQRHALVCNIRQLVYANAADLVHAFSSHNSLSPILHKPQLIPAVPLEGEKPCVGHPLHGGASEDRQVPGEEARDIDEHVPLPRFVQGQLVRLEVLIWEVPMPCNKAFEQATVIHPGCYQLLLIQQSILCTLHSLEAILIKVEVESCCHRTAHGGVIDGIHLPKLAILLCFICAPL
mmetsp:Transcript_24268/g.47186  ORF Transcript_24268/g.47186 Transcript_24268/m.47186 type:complete len:230 (-) Transcript_24268:339-1028(-)